MAVSTLTAGLFCDRLAGIDIRARLRVFFSLLGNLLGKATRNASLTYRDRSVGPADEPTPARPIEHLRKPRASVGICERESPGIPQDPVAEVRRNSSNTLRLRVLIGSATNRPI